MHPEQMVEIHQSRHEPTVAPLNAAWQLGTPLALSQARCLTLRAAPHLARRRERPRSSGIDLGRAGIAGPFA